MTDRELLELAAKAAGKPIRWDGDVAVLLDPDWQSDKCSAWNPLADDGDALRLAVKLKLDVRFPQDCDMYVDAGPCDAFTVYLIDAGNDRAAATRRAIVRAAAALAS